uniref:ELM2 domain-containing protein n=1 Tax=Strongyloides venezuelensis TaxID=75913 RepID=A0A0K0G4M4_STRVS
MNGQLKGQEVPSRKRKKNSERSFLEELQIRRSTRIQHIPEESEFYWLAAKKDSTGRHDYTQKLKVGPKHQVFVPELKSNRNSQPQKTTEILIWDPKQDNADEWSIEKQAIVHEFADAVEDYGYDYLEALNILRQCNCDPLESSRYVEAYIPHHSFKPFSSAEELLLKNCKKKANKPQKKQQVFQQMVHESKRTHKEIVEHYRKTKKHTCESVPRRKKCWCKERLIIKPVRNIIKRRDCKNCRDRLYLNSNLDLRIYTDSDKTFPLCSLCKFYYNHTNKMRVPVVEFDPSESDKSEKKQEINGEVEKTDIPESHVSLILTELEAHSLDIDSTVTGLRENHGIVTYTHSHIRWFVTTQAYKYNIHFNNSFSEGHTVERGNLETGKD